MGLHGDGLTSSSSFASLRGKKCTLGIDEAGRGPVLGPMVYAIAVCQTSHLDVLQTLQVADSKEISEEKREDIFAKINGEEYSLCLAYAFRALSPQHISACMLRRVKHNLNELSHETAMDLIQLCVDEGIKIDAVYVDTVGPPDTYQAKLLERFPSLNITVSKKADSLFPIVSAASICAKVTRDKNLKNWRFLEGKLVKGLDIGVGSGYPGDPVTKEFLRKNVDPVFGFPSIVRFSWSTADEMITKQCVKVKWDDDNVKPAAVGTKSILNFFPRMKRPAPATRGNSTAINTPGKETYKSAVLEEFSLQVVENLPS